MANDDVRARVRTWFDGFRNTALSANTDAWNHLQTNLPALEAALTTANDDPSAPLNAWFIQAAGVGPIARDLASYELLRTRLEDLKSSARPSTNTAPIQSQAKE